MTHLEKHELCIVCKNSKRDYCLIEEENNIYMRIVLEKVVGKEKLPPLQRAAVCLFLSTRSDMYVVVTFKNKKFPSDYYLIKTKIEQGLSKLLASAPETYKNSILIDCRKDSPLLDLTEFETIWELLTQQKSGTPLSHQYGDTAIKDIKNLFKDVLGLKRRTQPTEGRTQEGDTLNGDEAVERLKAFYPAICMKENLIVSELKKQYSRAIYDWQFFLPRNHVNKPVENGEYRIFDPKWEEAILLWFKNKDIKQENKEEFIDALLNFKDGCSGSFYEYRAYLLAFEAIAEFNDCSRADEIVKGIVKYGFGYFDKEKEKWLKLPTAMANEAIKTILAGTNHLKIINALSELCQQEVQDEDVRRLAAVTLAKIDPGNEIAIDALIKLAESSELQNKYIKRLSIKNLGEIGLRAPKAIDALIKLSLNDQTVKDTWQTIPDSLGQIGTGTPQVLANLTKLCQDAQKKYTEKFSTWPKGKEEKIELYTPQAIAALIKLCLTALKEYLREQENQNLTEIKLNATRLMVHIIELALNIQNEYIRWQDAKLFGKMGISNPNDVLKLIDRWQDAHNKYINLLNEKFSKELEQSYKTIRDDLLNLCAIAQTKDRHEDVHRLTAVLLAQLDFEETTPQDTLETLCNSSKPDNSRLSAMALINIKPDNATALNTLIKPPEDIKKYKYIYCVALYSLGKINPGNEQALKTLTELCLNSQDDYVRWLAAKSLSQISRSKKQALKTLTELCLESRNESIDNLEAINAVASIHLSSSDEGQYILAQTTDSLGKINPALIQLFVLAEAGEYISGGIAKSLTDIATDEDISKIITTMKKELSNETRKNDAKKYDICYSVLHYYAQSLSYPNFYQTWHS